MKRERQLGLLQGIVLLISLLYLGGTYLIAHLCDLFSKNFWTNFGFMFLLAVLMLGITMFRSIGNRTFFQATARYAKLIAGYVVYAAVLSLALMYIKTFPWPVSFLLQFVSAALFCLFLCVKSVGATHIKEVHEKQTKEVQYLIELEGRLCEARDVCESDELKSAYEKIIREVQNSSYRSFPEVHKIEKELLSLAEDLIVLDEEDQAATIKKIHVLLNRRKNAIQSLRQGV